MSHFKGMSYEDIIPIFERVWDQNNAFVPKDSKIEKEVMKRPGFYFQQKSSKKRSREDFDEDNANKQKLKDDAEKKEIRDSMDVVPIDDIAIDVESLATKYPIVDWKIHVLIENMMYYQIIRADGSSKNYKIFSEMLDNFDREDVLDLHRLVQKRLPHPGQGILGSAHAIYSSQPTTLPSAFSNMPPQDPTCHMDTGVSSHLNFNASNLSTIFDKRLFPSVHVGDGKSIPVTNTGHSIIPSHHRPLHLHNVLVTPNIIKNLIYVRQFTRDNNCTIEFDAFGFSMKDYLTRHILIRCDSSGDLYLVTKLSTSPIAIPRQVFLSQKKYALQLLERAHMVTCNPSRTPIDTKSKLGPKGVSI
ncbi:hypothetical protein Tco_0436266 [Tanacetum coccineum]